MIRSVRIRSFKHFRDAEFRLPGHTLLQAIASWALALRRRRDVGDYRRRYQTCIADRAQRPRTGTLMVE